jgi:hypothetical protein
MKGRDVKAGLFLPFLQESTGLQLFEVPTFLRKNSEQVRRGRGEFAA